MVLSQRLVRKLCPNCKVVVKNNDPKELVKMGFTEDEISDLTIYGPKGCPACTGTGYKGRLGLYELMEVTEDVAKAINAGAPEDQLRKTGINEGMLPLRDAGLEKIRQGVTSIEEVSKRTAMTKEALPAYLVNPDIERYENGDVIIREGNTDVDFFKLVQGALYVVKDGKKIAQIVQPGEYFGEMAAISGESRSASIISNGRSIIRRFPGEKLPELIEKYPEVARNLFEIIVSRLNKSNEVTIRLLNQLKGKKN
jgi:type IV pilus assembly protein PilB